MCEELKIELSDLTNKSDLNLANNLSELLGDELFEDLDILGPEVQDLVNTNPKIARALIKLGDNYKQKGQEIYIKANQLIYKVVENILQENKYLTPDLGGNSSTEKLTEHIIESIENHE